MKAMCNREALLSACQLTSAALSTKDIKPILKNIKAIADSDRCTLIATDLEVGIRLDVMGLEVEETGEAILPAARLIAILREARDSRLQLQADANACNVTGASLEFEMASEDPSSFPDFPTFNEEKYHEISAGALREMIRRTLFSVAEEGQRYAMTGVMWELDGDTARLVGTDGKRLSMADGIATAVGGHSTKGQLPVVPKKAMSLLERNLQDSSEEVIKISLRPNEVLFRTGRAVIYSRLVEGRFPDYRAVMPKKAVTKLDLNVGDFYSAVRQAAIMTDPEGPRVTFEFGKDKLTLRAHGATAGRSKVERPLENPGKPVDVNIDPRFLTEFLKVLPQDGQLKVELNDAGSPVLFKFEEQYSYLVMPLT